MSPTQLAELALTAREAAYTPYSNYKVGAVVVDDQRRTHTGCNVENVSYGACICAERTAIVKMVSEGGKEIREIAVATKDGGTPCGICLQVISEFVQNPNSVQVHLVNEKGALRSFSFADLLPHGFKSDEVARTECG